MANASGIEHVEPSLRHPTRTTSHGTGQLLRQLYSNEGITDILIGVGGSVTVDCGLGVLYGFGGIDWELEGPAKAYFTGDDLSRLKKLTPQDPLANDLKITIACDVTNPLLGPNGATYVFGPQKGLQPHQLEAYEGTMAQAAQVLVQVKGRSEVCTMPHGGAAGGIAAGLHAVFDDVKILSGMDLVLDLTGLKSLLTPETVVITGEGSFDSQSKQGKVIGRLMELTSNIIVICGRNTTPASPDIFDFVSRFGIERSLGQPYECLGIVVEEVWQHLQGAVNP
jgi:glycerate kinase